MNLEYTHHAGMPFPRARNPKRIAVKVCLYNSKRYAKHYHLDPLIAEIKNKQRKHDLIITVARDFEPAWLGRIPHEGVIVHRAVDIMPEFYQHMLRYVGTFPTFDWIFYRGSDTPELHQFELDALAATRLVGAQRIIWAPWWVGHLDVAGRMALNSLQVACLQSFLKDYDLQQWSEDYWHLDEEILSEWWRRSKDITREVVIALERIKPERKLRYLEGPAAKLFLDCKSGKTTEKYAENV